MDTPTIRETRVKVTTSEAEPKGTRCQVCGVSSYEKTLVGLRNDRRRNGPRYCLPHHPDSMASVGDVRL